MRSRNVKPGLFSNELLGKADPLLTILFIGLWCAADREGRLEDRPLKLTAQIFPMRRAVSEKRMDVMLQWLHDNRFIRRYTVNGKAFIQVMEFSKHQRPHSKEQASRIPALTSLEPLPRSGDATTKDDPAPQSRSLPARSDSGFLIPDSGFLIPDSAPVVPIDHHARFVACMKSFPKYSGRKHLIMAEHGAVSIVTSKLATWDAIEEGTKRYAAFVTATGRTVMSPANFFANDGDPPCLQAWEIPEQSNAGKSAVDKITWRPDGA